MTGQEYLEDIRTNLESGRNQHRMGENILRAFGYVRRRATAIEEINATLEELGLLAEPPVNSEMPLRAPRIRFSLSAKTDAMTSEADDGPDKLDSGMCDVPLPDAEDEGGNLPEPAFSVSELARQILRSSACPLMLRSRRPIPRCSSAIILSWSSLNTQNQCNKPSKALCRSNRLRRQ